MMAEAMASRPGGPASVLSPAAPAPPTRSGGIHIAQQDSTPLILFVGQVERENRGRDAFQEMDYRALFGGMAKWVAEIDEPDRMAEMVARAFATAMAGRPGPVVLSLPHDMLPLPSKSPDAPRVSKRMEIAPGADKMAALEDLLAKAREAVPDSGRQPLERAGAETDGAISPNASAFRWPPAFAAPIISIRCIPAMPAIWAWPAIPS